MGVLKVVPKNECVGHEYVRGRDTLYPLKCVALRSFVEFFENTESLYFDRGTKIEKLLNDNSVKQQFSCFWYP